MSDLPFTILFFAHFKELAGAPQVEIHLPPNATVADLKARLASVIPALVNALPTAVVAINQEFGFDEDLIPSGAEIAIFPPVSGGSGAVIQAQITTEPLDLNQLTAQHVDAETGAVCLFVGVVRGETHRSAAHTTASLEYEAYTAMAEAKLRQIGAEIQSRWPQVLQIALVQRIGILEPGAPSVAVICTAAHRDEGVFEAARYGIDRLKEIAPIWKKEIGPNGETWVDGDYHPQPGD